MDSMWNSNCAKRGFVIISIQAAAKKNSAMKMMFSKTELDNTPTRMLQLKSFSLACGMSAETL